MAVLDEAHIYAESWRICGPSAFPFFTGLLFGVTGSHLMLYILEVVAVMLVILSLPLQGAHKGPLQHCIGSRHVVADITLGT